jgi:nucleoside-diphosphate-sugar epimerase
VHRVNRLLLLGVGSVARAVRAALPDYAALGTTRSTPDARFAGIEPISTADHAAIRVAAQGARVLVSFPPDGASDRAFSALVAGANSVAYLSSTAVYSPTQKHVNEHTAATPSNERARLRLEAEALWQSVGASVVRLPAFYGSDAGLHVSLSRGTFRMPGSGENVVSRVHVDDAARFVCSAFTAPPRSLLLAGDAEPARVADVVAFVCELFALPPPASAEGADVPLSLRASRRIDNCETRARYGVSLTYPSYREGYRAIHDAMR